MPLKEIALPVMMSVSKNLFILGSSQWGDIFQKTGIIKQIFQGGEPMGLKHPQTFLKLRFTSVSLLYSSSLLLFVIVCITSGPT